MTKKPSLLRPGLQKALLERIEESTNEEERLHRVKIYNRFLGYFQNADGDMEALWEDIRNDYDVFCATQIVNTYGQPFFPAIFQSEAAQLLKEGKFDEYFIFACRRSGKSSWAATVIIWLMQLVPYTIVQIYAPTEPQLFIIKYIVDNIERNDFLRDTLIPKPVNWNLKKRYVRFKNGSEADTWSMGMGFTGDSARGGGGNLLVIEEVGLWRRGDLDAVVKPMKREKHTKKAMIFIGTPTLDYNPDLPIEWERAKEAPNVWTRSFSCWDAVREGVRSPDIMKDTFRDYGIPCKIVKEHGVCPVHMSDYYTDLPLDFQCPYNMVCEENDDFVREELIGFPKVSGALFPMEKVRTMFYDGMTLTDRPESDSRTYIMAADSALLDDYTQIIVAELLMVECSDGEMRPGLRVVYWMEINPEEITGADFQPVVAAYKQVHKVFNPARIYADASTTGGVIISASTMGKDAIPPRKFVKNSHGNKDVLGLTWTGEFKDMLFKNAKTQMLRGTIQLPFVQPFAKKMIDELTSLIAKPIITGRYDSIQTRRGKKKDLASAFAMLCWELYDEHFVPSSMRFNFAKKTGRAPLGPAWVRDHNLVDRTDGSGIRTYKGPRAGFNDASRPYGQEETSRRTFSFGIGGKKKRDRK